MHLCRKDVKWMKSACEIAKCCPKILEFFCMQVWIFGCYTHTHTYGVRQIDVEEIVSGQRSRRPKYRKSNSAIALIYCRLHICLFLRSSSWHVWINIALDFEFLGKNNTKRQQKKIAATSTSSFEASIRIWISSVFGDLTVFVPSSLELKFGCFFHHSHSVRWSTNFGIMTLFKTIVD